MVVKTGRFGKFLACPNYPKCKNTKNLDEDGNIVEPTQPEVSDVICDKCGATMVVKTGRYGKFLACPNYPKCKNIVNIDKPEQKADRQTASALSQVRKAAQKDNDVPLDFLRLLGISRLRFRVERAAHRRELPRVRRIPGGKERQERQVI